MFAIEVELLKKVTNLMWDDSDAKHTWNDLDFPYHPLEDRKYDFSLRIEGALDELFPNPVVSYDLMVATYVLDAYTTMFVDPAQRPIPKHLSMFLGRVRTECTAMPTPPWATYQSAGTMSGTPGNWQHHSRSAGGFGENNGLGASTPKASQKKAGCGALQVGRDEARSWILPPHDVARRRPRQRTR